MWGSSSSGRRKRSTVPVPNLSRIQSRGLTGSFAAPSRGKPDWLGWTVVLVRATRWYFHCSAVVEQLGLALTADGFIQDDHFPLVFRVQYVSPRSDHFPHMLRPRRRAISTYYVEAHVWACSRAPGGTYIGICRFLLAGLMRDTRFQSDSNYSHIYT